MRHMRELNPHLLHTDDPLKSTNPVTTRQTQAVIKEMLKDGTPDWFTHPEDYKHWAREAYLADKEKSDDQVAEYRDANEAVLTDFDASFVNIIGTKDFMNKLRANKVRCWSHDAGMPKTMGLWVSMPGIKDPIYITFMQVPAMPEWDIMRLDEHYLPDGLDYRGWRSVVYELINKKILTEQKAHEIFGAPTGDRACLYRRNLWKLRNGKKKHKSQ